MSEPPRAQGSFKRGENLKPDGVYLLPGETKLIAVSERPPKEKLATTNEWEELKRWLRWNAICLRGRKCAEIEIGEMIPSQEICVQYTCEGCGTRYLFSTKHGRSRR